MTTLIGCPERSFAAFGGMVRQVLYDNMNHAGFLDYARHAGFVIKLCLCRPYRARTKGQVKRFNVSVRSASWSSTSPTAQSRKVEVKRERDQTEVTLVWSPRGHKRKWPKSAKA